jgi:riboflavin synthase
MFTGLVQGMGQVERIAERDGELRVRVTGAVLEGLARGESIAVDGVCLTAVETGEGYFEAIVAPETVRRTTLARRAAGDAVNLERSLRLGDRLGGHLVQGHVDGIGSIRSVEREGSGARLRIVPPPGLSPFIVMKGSIAVDGVSLTVAARDAEWFEVALIPETMAVTVLGRRRAADAVNLEVDLIGRYVVQSLIDGESGPGSGVTRELLADQGFGTKEVVS